MSGFVFRVALAAEETPISISVISPDGALA
jgi:hypothetical protein